jgi:hypothetical protein
MIDRKTATIALVALMVGYWLSGSHESPLGPPAPPDRPVLRFLARAAKSLLWVALAAEKPPEPVEQTYVVHAQVGRDGHPILNHARGW